MQGGLHRGTDLQAIGGGKCTTPQPYASRREPSKAFSYENQEKPTVVSLICLLGHYQTDRKGDFKEVDEMDFMDGMDSMDGRMVAGSFGRGNAVLSVMGRSRAASDPFSAAQAASRLFPPHHAQNQKMRVQRTPARPASRPPRRTRR